MMHRRFDAREIVDNEIEFHLEMQVRRYVAEGMSPDAARAAAMARFGDVIAVRDECQEIAIRIEGQVKRAELFAELRQDVAYAVRTLRRSPLYTLVALVTLAVGIGFNTAIFSVVNATLLRPLPYRHADRVLTIWNGTGASRSERTAVAAPEFADYIAQTTSFDALAALRVTSMTFAPPCRGDRCGPEQVVAHVVSPTLFDLLGTTPQLGRGFSPNDGAALPAAVVVLGDALWRRYGGDSSIVGRVVRVNGIPRTVIGVAAAQMRFPDAPVGFVTEPADLYLPLQHERQRDERGNQNLAVLARLAPGVTIEAARRDLDRVADGFRVAYRSRYVDAAPTWRIVALPLADDMFGDARPMLLVVFGASGLVLLIVCANVANLTLARGVARLREAAVRAALGASRGRLIRQTLTESVCLAVAGGTLGAVMAIAAVPALVRLDPGNVPRFERVHVDATALVFSLVVSGVAGLGLGLLPALRLSDYDLRAPFGDDGTRVSGGHHASRIRRSLLVVQVAVSVTMLVGAGLLMRSFAALAAVPPGFEARDVQTFRVAFPTQRFDSAYKSVAAVSRIADAIGTGAAAQVSGVYPLPMAGEGWSGSFTIEGRSDAGAGMPHAEYAVALPGYFATMGIPLVEGRAFGARDDLSAPNVAVIDATLARRYWPGGSPIGKRLSTVGAGGPWAVIVGVVGHVRRAGPRNDGEPQIYLAALQRPQPALYFVARGMTTASFATAARDAVRSVDRELVVASVQPMAAVEASTVSRERFNVVLFSAFGIVGLLVASVGVFGLVAYMVAQRRQEIAVRAALGGGRRAVVALFAREAVVLTGAGLVLGLLASVMASRLLTTLLFGVGAFDAPTYVAISLLFLLVTTLAAAGPALRAARTDPARALRG
jgi:putative ABC transport system permease protein